MYSYFDYLEATFSDIVSTEVNRFDFTRDILTFFIEVVGQSYEGRDIKVAKVCKGGCGNKKAVWIDGGIHARFTITILPSEITFKHSTESGCLQPQ